MSTKITTRPNACSSIYPYGEVPFLVEMQYENKKQSVDLPCNYTYLLLKPFSQVLQPTGVLQPGRVTSRCPQERTTRQCAKLSMPGVPLTRLSHGMTSVFKPATTQDQVILSDGGRRLKGMIEFLIDVISGAAEITRSASQESRPIMHDSVWNLMMQLAHLPISLLTVGRHLSLGPRPTKFVTLYSVQTIHAVDKYISRKEVASYFYSWSRWRSEGGRIGPLDYRLAN